MGRLKRKRPHSFSNKFGILTAMMTILLYLWGCNDTASPKISSIYINESDYDFGIISDSINEVQHSFCIVNNTDDTCRITNIEKSCGCTKIDMDSYLVLPHDSTKFKVNLDIGSNYSFIEKDVNIYIEGCDSPLTLYLRATRKVPQVLVKKEFPFRLSDNLRLSSQSALLGYAQHEQERIFSINLLNSSDKTKHLKLKSVMPDGFDVIYPSEIAPQEISRIVFTCKLKDTLWGEISFDCIFEDDNGMTSPIKVYVIATEKFDKTKLTYPRICVPITAYDSKVLNSSNCISFKFINVGPDTLFIRHIQNSDKNIKAYSDKKECLPKDTCNVFVEVSNNYKIQDDVIIGVTTNDKMEPYKQLRIIK